MKIYMFEYDPITCCQECPFFYDYIYCEAIPVTAEDWKSRQNEIKYTWSDDSSRPVNCPLLEVIGPNDA